MTIILNELSILGLGFLLGLQHSTDTDHLVAVSALISKHKDIKKAILAGSFWGFGHTLTLLIVGVFLLFLKISLPEKIILSFEFLVGVLIVIIGISVLIDAKKNKMHVHIHKHKNKKHIHIHNHKEKKDHNHIHSFVMGGFHGVAGSAGLMLLILQTTASIKIGIFYILIFGLGSIVGMSIFSGLLSFPFVFSNNNWNNKIKYSTGVFSVLFGIFLMIIIGKRFIQL